MRVDMDTSELRALAADMHRIPERLTRWVIPVVERGAVNIKNQLQSEMGESRHFGQIAPSIGYDMNLGAGVIEAEVGPSSEPGSVGNLANIAYFGGARGGGTVPDPNGALEAEGPKFESALGDLLGDLL